MAIIGADHASVEGSKGQFDLTGDAAQITGSDATSASREMEGHLDEIMALFKGQFEETAADLQQRVADHKSRLEATNWQGTSRERALAAEGELTTEIDRVLGQALEQVETFRSMMHSQADSFVAAVEGQFRQAMQEADAAYKEHAAAQQLYLANLRSADQTIQ